MLLAIIMDVYTEVKGSIGSKAETITSQTMEIFRRWNDVRVGKEITLEHVLSCIDPTDLDADDDDEGISTRQPEGACITIGDLVQMVPKMHEEQAVSILL